MKKIIDGYMYSSDDGKYLGIYPFPNNLDKEDIHLPPFTTLNEPIINEGYEAYFVNGKWDYKEVLKEDEFIEGFSDLDDYSQLTDGFIKFMKSQNKWTHEMQLKYESDVAALNASKEDAANTNGSVN
jgi:hypothetical protein